MNQVYRLMMSSSCITTRTNGWKEAKLVTMKSITLKNYPHSHSIASDVLKQFDLYPCDVPADGSCLPSSLCISLGFMLSATSVMRFVMINAVLEYWDHRGEFSSASLGAQACLSINERLQKRNNPLRCSTKDQYMRVALAHETYLSESEIEAFAMKMQVNVVVHNATEGVDPQGIGAYSVFPMCNGGLLNPHWMCIRILYVGNHYVALRRMSETGHVYSQSCPTYLQFVLENGVVNRTEMTPVRQVLSQAPVRVEREDDVSMDWEAEACANVSIVASQLRSFYTKPQPTPEPRVVDEISDVPKRPVPDLLEAVRVIVGDANVRLTKQSIRRAFAQIVKCFRIPADMSLPGVRRSVEDHKDALSRIVSHFGMDKIRAEYATENQHVRVPCVVDLANGNDEESDTVMESNDNPEPKGKSNPKRKLSQSDVEAMQRMSTMKHKKRLAMEAAQQLLNQMSFPAEELPDWNVCYDNDTKQFIDRMSDRSLSPDEWINCGKELLERDNLPIDKLKMRSEVFKSTLCRGNMLEGCIVDQFLITLETQLNHVARRCIVHTLRGIVSTQLQLQLDISFIRKMEEVYEVDCITQVPMLVLPYCQNGCWCIIIWLKETNTVEVYGMAEHSGRYMYVLASKFLEQLKEHVRGKGTSVHQSFLTEMEDAQIIVVPPVFAPHVSLNDTGVFILFIAYYRCQRSSIPKTIDVHSVRQLICATIFKRILPFLVSSYNKLRHVASDARWRPIVNVRSYPQQYNQSLLPTEARAVKDGLSQKQLLEVIAHVLHEPECRWTKKDVVKCLIRLIQHHDVSTNCDAVHANMPANEAKVKLVETVMEITYTTIMASVYTSELSPLLQPDAKRLIEQLIEGLIDTGMSRIAMAKQIYDAMQREVSFEQIVHVVRQRASGHQTLEENVIESLLLDEEAGPEDADEQAVLLSESNSNEDVCTEGNDQQSLSFDEASQRYLLKAKSLPTHVCSCCDQLFFKHSMCSLPMDRIIRLHDDIVATFDKIDGAYQFCATCASSLRQNKLPKLSKANGMKLPEMPECLARLTELEERLVAPRQAFAQFRKLIRGGQRGLKGSVVNVPANTDIVQTILPRLADVDQTVGVRLKRRLEYACAYCSESVRPSRINEALEFLIGQPLYKREGVQRMESLDVFMESLMEGLRQHQDNVEELEMFECDNDWEETPHPNNATAALHTMIQNYDSAHTLRSHSIEDEQNDPSNVYNIAPSQGMRPLGLFQDKNSEELNFPKIFCGQSRDDYSKQTVRLSYKERCKWELRTRDRRVAMCTSNLFFKLRLSQIIDVRRAAWVRIRKSKLQDKNLTASQVVSAVDKEQLLASDIGYHDLIGLRTSPDYYDQLKKSVFAMLRQLGTPTWFFTFSAADLHWYDLLVALAKTVDGKDISEEEAKEMSYDEKNRLIASDPITCARFYRNRMEAFRTNVLQNCPDVLGGFVDDYIRDEFQQRGTPHSHGVGWPKDAPMYGRDPDEVVIEYIDKYIQCDRESLGDKVFMQEHRHTNYCKRCASNECRFGFPKPPLPKTMILKPFEDEEASEQQKSRFKRIWSHIYDYLNSIAPNDVENHTYSFDEFLAIVNVSFDDYVNAIRSSIDRPTVLLKRKVCDIRINAYNEKAFKLWGANMDIQFVLDPYAAAMYIVSYMMKGQRGLSKIMEKTIKECREGNSSIIERIRKTGNAFMNAQEICAQETAYLLLGLPLKQSSRDVVFINTNIKENRAFILKSDKELKQLPADSSDIGKPSLVDRYVKRPNEMKGDNNICLADFGCWYDKSEPGYRKRRKAKVLRCVRFSKTKQPEDYYRELYMLYHPFESELEVEDPTTNGYTSHEDRYLKLKEVIDAKKDEYEKVINWDELQAAIQAQENNVTEWHYNGVPEGDGEEFDEYDCIADLGGCRTGARNEKVRLVDMLPNDEYYKLMTSLNEDQRAFHNHCMYWVKHKENEQQYAFLSGGAGVGKTLLTHALIQSLTRHYRAKPGAPLDKPYIMVCAPTGKAAFIVKGNTIHSGLGIKVNQAKRDQPLNGAELASKKTLMEEVRVLIIDEVSMVGASMFHLIHKRMQQIKGSSKPFGGLHVIVVGDLFQIPPTGDSWIFNNPFIGLSALATNLWREYFRMFELTQVMRQNDGGFAALLNRLREGRHTKEDIETLLAREGLPVPPNTPHLFTTNDEVDKHNLQDFNSNLNPPFVIRAKDTPVKQMSPASWEKLQSYIPKSHKLTMGMFTELKLKVGMAVEMVLNESTADGLCNGADGVLMAVSRITSSQNNPALAWVKFNDKEVGKLKRAAFQSLYDRFPSIQKDWTPVFAIERSVSIGKNEDAQINRTQLPIAPCAGRTVNRSQGMTLLEIYCDFRLKAGSGKHYVGISRVTSIDGLFFPTGGLCVEKIRTSAAVQQEMRYLRNHGRLPLCIRPLSILKQQGHFVIAAQNVVSWRLHKENAVASHDIRVADVLVCSETKASIEHESDIYTRPEMHAVRVDCHVAAESGVAARGLLTFTRPQPMKVHKVSMNKCQMSYIEVITEWGLKLAVISIYRSPSCCLSTIEQTLRQMVNRAGSLPFVALGDFNTDPNCSMLSSIFKEAGASQVIYVPTRGHNLLDHIWTNLPTHIIRTGVILCFFSDHDTTFITIHRGFTRH